MKSKWVKKEDFNWEKENDFFDCFIFFNGEVVKARYEGVFNFKYGVCGRGVPSHIMKIKTPKPPYENES